MPGKEGMIPNYILKTLEEEALGKQSKIGS